mmetsp:Transcript_5915/g.9824  ORF Transcript_5915/g.9824 Transcript_5915/m.9824 type:complete len:86 (+) Transcript_5915:434-691(+)
MDTTCTDYLSERASDWAPSQCVLRNNSVVFKCMIACRCSARLCRRVLTCCVHKMLCTVHMHHITLHRLLDLTTLIEYSLKALKKL